MHIWGEREKERARKRPENREEKERDRETVQPPDLSRTLDNGNTTGRGERIGIGKGVWNG